MVCGADPTALWRWSGVAYAAGRTTLAPITSERPKSVRRKTVCGSVRAASAPAPNAPGRNDEASSPTTAASAAATPMPRTPSGPGATTAKQTPHRIIQKACTTTPRIPATSGGALVPNVESANARPASRKGRAPAPCRRPSPTRAPAVVAAAMRPIRMPVVSREARTRESNWGGSLHSRGSVAQVRPGRRR